MHFKTVIFLVFVYSRCCFCQYEGGQCIVARTKEKGICTLLEYCPEAVAGIPRGEYPQHCSFRGITPIVCCLTPRDKPGTVDKPAEDKITVVTKPTTDRTSVVTKPSSENPTTVTKAPSTQTTVKTKLPPGQMARAMCEEYKKLRPQSETCAVPTSDLLFRSESNITSWPELVLLGYDKLDRRCGGVLISETHVLTAASCLNDAKTVQLSDGQVKPIIWTKPHPDYSSPASYNDIGVVALGGNKNTCKVYSSAAPCPIPACLPVTGDPVYPIVGLSWGGKGSGPVLAGRLDDAGLSCGGYEDEELGVLPVGVVPDLQVCARPRGACRELAPGSPSLSAAPEGGCPRSVLTLAAPPTATCPYTHALHTRLSYYVDWIESVVWN